MEKIIKSVFLIILISSCQSTKNVSGGPDYLFKVGETPVSPEEFIYVYRKNNLNRDSAFQREDVSEYLELFINFKLKVKEAKALGLDQKESFKNELEGYRKQLAKPYLTESKVTDQLVSEAYDRLKLEINASHILLRLSPSAGPEDTVRVYKKILEIRERIRAGESFATVAKEVSEDPSAKTNGGNLGYFSAFQMVYPFETAAYNTPVDSISDPVRTRFGYHILKVHDKRPSSGKVKVSHIMIRSNEGMPREARENNEKKINEIYKRLLAGEDWNSLSRQFSQDLSSSKKGGALPWIGTGNVDPTFEAAAFGLQNPGDIAAPVLSPYGWHIIRLDDKKNIEPFEEIAGKLKERIEKDSRSALSREMLVRRLKAENEYVPYHANLDKVIALADSSLLNGKWQIGEGHRLSGQTLFTIMEDSIKVDSFLNYLAEKQRPRSGFSPEMLMKNYYDQFVQQRLIDYEEAHLAEKYEDYRMLLKEYHEGILLFELMDEKVWSKAMKDSVGLVKFFEENRENYVWKPRAEAVIINVSDQKVLDRIKALKINSKFAIKTISLSHHNKVGENGLPAVDQLIRDLKSGKGEAIIIQSGPGNGEGLTGIKQYMIGQGVNGDQITLEESDDADQFTIRLLSSKAKLLEGQYNSKDALAVEITEGIFETGENEILDKVNWGDGKSEVFKEGDRYYWVIIKNTLPPSPKKLIDIKGAVISDYQNHLEKKWIEDLKLKYPVKINDIAFEKVIEKLEKI